MLLIWNRYMQLLRVCFLVCTGGLVAFAYASPVENNLLYISIAIGVTGFATFACLGPCLEVAVEFTYPGSYLVVFLSSTSLSGPRNFNCPSVCPSVCPSTKQILLFHIWASTLSVLLKSDPGAQPTLLQIVANTEQHFSLWLLQNTRRVIINCPCVQHFHC